MRLLPRRSRQRSSANAARGWFGAGPCRQTPAGRFRHHFGSFSCCPVSSHQPKPHCCGTHTYTDSVLSTFSAGSGTDNYFSSAVHPTDGRLYVLNQTAVQVEVYDPATETLLSTVSLSGFVEPRMVGRWLAAGPSAALPPVAISVPIFSASPLPLVLLALLTLLIARRGLLNARRQ